ncbi:hypothetical protein BC937DRAFT_93638 [Endogone sp. FLAS-F59071]|nr:hypothetical protein BC937DRAFT_93638 [Endogone sp. FLAS-F59071]|eukprot:RUS21102.1 hypothetical protein BC937DRAFT_93638 [Endogone sp. FLAS-F59071]
MVDDDLVEVAAAKVPVERRRLDAQLAFNEGNDSDRIRRVADIAEDDMARFFLGKVGLGDAVTEGSGGSIVDEAEGIQTRDLSGVENRAALDVSEPTGNRDDHIRDRDLDFVLSDLLELGKVHGQQLHVREFGLLAEVFDLEKS